MQNREATRCELKASHETGRILLLSQVSCAWPSSWGAASLVIFKAATASHLEGYALRMLAL